MHEPVSEGYINIGLELITIAQKAIESYRPTSAGMLIQISDN